MAQASESIGKGFTTARGKVLAAIGAALVAAAVAVGGSAAYLFSQTEPIVNTFTSGLGPSVKVAKTVDAPAGLQDAAEELEFSFTVDLGETYANQTVEVRISVPVEGADPAVSVTSVTLGEDGSFAAKLSHGQSLEILDVVTGTEVAVTEEPFGAFALQDDEDESTQTVEQNGRTVGFKGTVGQGSLSFSFVNEYEYADPMTGPDDGLDIVIQKKVVGRDWRQGDSFEFAVEHGSYVDGEWTVAKKADGSDAAWRVAVGSDDADGQTGVHGALLEDILSELVVPADELYASGSLELFFRIYEDCDPASAVGGLTYDAAVREIAVTLTDEDWDGVPEVRSVESEGEKDVFVEGESGGSFILTASFANIHAPSAVVADVKASKSMAGGSAAHELSGFTFALQEADSAYEPLPGVAARELVTDVNGNATWSLTLESAGIYHYVLSEIAGAEAGMSYDEATFGAKVVVENQNGALSAAVSYVELPSGATIEGGVPEFVNKYEPAPAVAAIEGEKILVGRDMADGEFSFELRDASGALVQTLSSPAAEDGEAAAFAFSELSFDEAGTYRYTVCEASGDIKGVGYDTSVFAVTVAVTDDRSGALKAETSVAGGEIMFRNSYSPEPAELKLSGQKTLVGRALVEGEFGFSLLEKGADGSLVEIDQAYNTADGTFAFDELTFAEVGTYEYQVVELAGTLEGVAYDASRIDVTVAVTDDGTGELKATASYEKDGAGAGGIAFLNEYEGPGVIEHATVPLRGQKTLAGRDLASGEFEFQLLDEAGNVVDSTANGVDGSFAFKDLVYESAGTYRYRVCEVNGGAAGVTYDASVYDVTVVVETDDAGKLSASASVAKGGSPVEGIAFENAFTAPTPGPGEDEGDGKLPGTDGSEGSEGSDLEQTGDSKVDLMWRLAAVAFVAGIAMILTAAKMRRVTRR